MKDFKPRSQPVKQTNIGNTLVGMFIGLMMGLLICAAIAVYMMKSPFPWSAKPKVPERVLAEPQAESKAPVAAPAVPVARPAAEPKAASNADARTDSATESPDKPRFEFYKILPGQDGTPPPPAEGSRPSVARPARPADAPAVVEHFILQAGAFQSPADADGLKARLALLGLEANVEPIDLPDRGTWYRVRLGPYSTVAEVNHVRSQLAQNGVDASLVRHNPVRR